MTTSEISSHNLFTSIHHYINFGKKSFWSKHSKRNILNFWCMVDFFYVVHLSPILMMEIAKRNFLFVIKYILFAKEYLDVYFVERFISFILWNICNNFKIFLFSYEELRKIIYCYYTFIWLLIFCKNRYV